MEIKIKSLHLENFKGAKDRTVNFAKNTLISGANATGKTTLFDAVTWLLFGKNSMGAEKFDVRPLDENGKAINFIDIVVSAVFEIDGKEVELKKTQKQNWIKPRGAEKQEFKGNVNSYEKDGYPMTEKDYKAFISELIDADMFRMLTNPMFFPSMEWKKQREILMGFVTEISDLDLATEIGGFDDLLSEIEKAPSVDDIQNKYKKAKKELEATLKEIPVRVDELSKQKVDIDLAELSLEKSSILKEKEKVADTMKSVDELKGEALELEFKINECSRKLNEDIIRKRREAEDELMLKEGELVNKQRELNTICRDIEYLTNEKAALTAKSVDLGTQYNTEATKKFDDSKWVFDESSKNCSMCGQMLPASRIDELVKNFEKNKQLAIIKFAAGQKEICNSLVEKGKELKGLIDGKVVEIEIKITERDRLTKEIENLNTVVSGCKADVELLPERANVMQDNEYVSLIRQREALEIKIVSLTNTLSNEVENEQDIRLKEIERQFALNENNAVIDTRIEELQIQQRDLSQKIADCEKMLYLVETFIKAKLDRITNIINSKFELANFTLFKTLINGGYEPCCEVSFNGVGYANLNAGHRIVVGIDICRTLAKTYDKNVFMFTDNAETVNSFNIPTVDCQLIQLRVTDEKELVVKGE